MEKKIGKIEKVFFGIAGYQDCMLGLHVALSGPGWGAHDTKSTWDPNKIECSKYCKWTEEDRSGTFDEITRYISDLLAAGKVNTIEQLIGKPIEATFDIMTLKEWRILTEAL